MESTDTTAAANPERHDLPDIESITVNQGFIPESRSAWWPWRRKPKAATT